MSLLCGSYLKGEFVECFSARLQSKKEYTEDDERNKRNGNMLRDL